jgi:hypothetical protein
MHALRIARALGLLVWPVPLTLFSLLAAAVSIVPLCSPANAASRCPKCSRPTQVAWKFCKHCGTQLPGPATALPLQAKPNATFAVTAVHTGQGVQVAINSHVWVTATQARADVKHPLQGEVTFLVTNDFFYQLSPNEKKGIKAPAPPEFRKNADKFTFLISKFTFDAGPALRDATKVRSENVAGYDCDVMTATESDSGKSRTVTVWMPQKMTPRFPIKAMMESKISKPGATLDESVTITLSSIKTNVPIPASTWRIPANYTIRAVTSPITPGLPKQ